MDKSQELLGHIASVVQTTAGPERFVNYGISVYVAIQSMEFF